LWEADTGKDVRTLPGHNSYLLTVAFSPDGKSLASGGIDRQIYVHDLTTGKLSAKFPSHQIQINCVTYSPDGRWLASVGGDAWVFIWNADMKPNSAPQPVARFSAHQGSINCIVFSPDSKSFATCGVDNLAKIHDVATGTERQVFRGHGGSVTCLTFT